MITPEISKFIEEEATPSVLSQVPDSCKPRVRHELLLAFNAIAIQSYQAATRVIVPTITEQMEGMEKKYRSRHDTYNLLSGVLDKLLEIKNEMGDSEEFLEEYDRR